MHTFTKLTRKAKLHILLSSLALVLSAAVGLTAYSTSRNPEPVQSPVSSEYKDFLATLAEESPSPEATASATASTTTQPSASPTAKVVVASKSPKATSTATTSPKPDRTPNGQPRLMSIYPLKSFDMEAGSKLNKFTTASSGSGELIRLPQVTNNQDFGISFSYGGGTPPLQYAASWSLNIEASKNITHTGIFTLNLSTYDNKGQAYYFPLVIVITVVPDFELSVQDVSDETTDQYGFDAIVTVSRKNGFTGPIDFTYDFGSDRFFNCGQGFVEISPDTYGISCVRTAGPLTDFVAKFIGTHGAYIRSTTLPIHF